MRYLITNPDSFGDMVLRQPLLTGLLDADNEVAVLVKKSYSAIVRFIDPRLKMFIIDDLNPYTATVLRGKEGLLKVLDDADRFNPDVVVSAPYQRTVLDNWTLDRFADRRTAGMNGIEVEYENDIRVFRPVTRHVDMILQVPEDLNEVEKNRRLLSLLLGKEAPLVAPRLELSPASRTLAEATLRQRELEEENYIICALGSSNVPIKQYPPERFTTVLRHWAGSYKRSILLAGNLYEKATIDEIAASLRSDSIRVSTWIGSEPDLELLLGLVSLSGAYFGNDTGPMHFAAAFGKPVIAIFGGGHWPRFMPAARTGAVVLQELPCFGCGWQCVFEKAICIQSIQEKRIIEAIDSFEGGTMKGFTTHAAPFEGEISSVWIQEAREKMKSYKDLIEVNRVEREKESGRFEQKVRDLTAELQTTRAERVQFEQRVHELTGELQTTRAERAQFEQRVRDLSTDLQTARAERERESKLHDEKVKALTAELQTSRTSLAKAQEQIQHLTAQNGTLKGEMTQMQEVVRAKDALNSALKQQLTESNQRIESINKQHEEMSRFLRGQISQLTEKLALAQPHKARAEEAEKLLREKDERARNAAAELLDLKPKLEELHLAVRLQEDAAREMGSSLNGLMKSGWMRLGLRAGIPWLTRWHQAMFGSRSPDAPFPVPTDKFQAMVSYKELLRGQITRIASTLGG